MSQHIVELHIKNKYIVQIIFWISALTIYI